MRSSGNLFLVSFQLLLALMLSGCELINPDEEVPSYIVVDSFTYDPSPTLAEMGPSVSTKLKDVWLYVDNEFQGAYELPARFPVLKTGNHRVILSPGILINGISSTRSPYPFLKGHTQDANLPANGELKINPVTSYFDSVKCHYCEDFEGFGFSLTSTAQSDTVMYQLSGGDPGVFEGSGSGVVYLEQTNSEFEVTSTTDYMLPGSGAAVYLEMDYKINQKMDVGLFISDPNTTTGRANLITLFPTETWNKTYIQLGYTVSGYPNATGFKVYFRALKDPLVSKSEFYLDNIKVVSF